MAQQAGVGKGAPTVAVYIYFIVLGVVSHWFSQLELQILATARQLAGPPKQYM